MNAEDSGFAGKQQRREWFVRGNGVGRESLSNKGVWAWLPEWNVYRTNSPRSACDRTPACSRAYNKGALFVRGKKPEELARISKISVRRWEQYESHWKRENPILKGLRFLCVFEQESVKTYAEAAEIVGVSRQRVYQVTWLVTKLPQEIKDFLLTNDDPPTLRYFTERRLRRLTRLASDGRMLEESRDMLAEAQGKGILCDAVQG